MNINNNILFIKEKRFEFQHMRVLQIAELNICKYFGVLGIAIDGRF